MKRMTARRGLVALAAVVSLFALSAAPAAAGAPDTIVGTITIGGDEVFEVGGPNANPCGSNTIDVVFSGTATAGTWSVTGAIKAPFTISSDPSATKYQADISFLAPSGGNYAASGATVTGTLNVQAVIRLLDKDGPDNVEGNGDDCAKGAAICTVRTRLIVDSSQSSHTGTLPVPAAGDVTDLVASSELTGGVRPVVVSGTCPVTIQGNIVGQSVVAALVLTW
jgi:hypothetical protein